MSSIYNILNIGKLSLMAQQKAIQVTSHNIANVNTDGYSRQEVIFEETTPLDGSPGQTGTGVNAADIQRKYDSFIEGQITDGKESYGNLDVQRNALSRIENLLYDSQGNSINVLLDDFFGAQQDLSANPMGTAERVAVLSRADTLAGAIRTVNTELVRIQKDMDKQIDQTVNDINSITSQIAMLNGKVSQAETSGQNANDYRDMRGRLINELAEKIDIQYFEDGNGQITVIGAGFATLVEVGNSWDLGVASNPDNNGYYDIVYSPGSNNSADMTDRISDGGLKGILTIRDSTTGDIINKLDRFAAGIANEINQLHRAGYGLDGSTGLNFFTPGLEAGDAVSVLTPRVSPNSGTGNVTVTIDDPSQLTYQEYELTFSGGNYTFTNKDANSSQSGANSGPASFTFEGLSVSITGSPDDGDIFAVSAHKDASKNMQVALDASDYDRIAAAAADTQSGNNRGDNRNAVAIAQLQDKLSMDGTSNFNGYYGSIVGGVGTSSQYINNSYSAQRFSLEQMENMREAVSGVSLDEEMANLMKFQRAFEASARLVGISDELLQTLLGMLG